MPKLSISQVIGLITIIGLFSTFVMRYGGLPQAVANVQQKVEQYQQDIVELKAGQHYVREKIDDVIDILKNNR